MARERSTARPARVRRVAFVAFVTFVALGVSLATACRGRESSAAESQPPLDVARADSVQAAAIADTTQWAQYGRDYTNQRYSPLGQITPANIGQLRLAWVNHSGIPHESESAPVVVDGVMYVSTALNHVLALDAATGQKIWEYAHDYAGHTVVDCCSAINKGVAVYGGRVYMGTVDARLDALDAKSGKLLWSVQVGDNNAGYHITGAPLAVGGLVITGVSGGEQGCRCYVDAYDARTGERQWRFYTIPSPQEGGWWGKWREHDEWGMSFHRDIAQEKRDSARYADAWQHGGGPMWHHPAYDPATGLLFINIGNAAPDNDGTVRPGDNLYTSSIVALDHRTGKLRWYFQEVAHDRWDYDATTPPVLIEVPDEHGQRVKAVAEAGKDGFVYVLERATGRPIRKSVPFVPLLNYMTPPDTAGVLVAPGTLGGSDWSPTAYSPATEYLYIDGNYLPMMYWLQHEELKPPAQWWGGTVAGATSGTYGLVSAVDLRTGQLAWQTRVAKPIIGGLLATAGGLVFTGTSADKHLAAFDARTGRQLWSAPTDGGVNAPPISYQVGGVQYVAVVVTGIQTLDTPRSDEVVAYALPHNGPAGAGLPGAMPPTSVLPQTPAESLSRRTTPQALTDSARHPTTPPAARRPRARPDSSGAP